MNRLWSQLRWVAGAGVLVVLASPCLGRGLTSDESLLLERARAIAAAPVNDFSVLGARDGARDEYYRYQLAFLAYGVCSVVAQEPELRNEGRGILVRFIEKMENPKTLAYWRALGYAGDGLSRGNAMYRGHLNLMYALAHDRFGVTQFDDRFHALSRELSEQLEGPHPVCCEPDHLFVQCNTVILLSLSLHDRDFGTRYAAAGQNLLSWTRRHMSFEGTHLVREDFRPSTGQSSVERAGYANAWALAFLAGVPGMEGDARAMYSEWRRVFVVQVPFFAAVRGAPPGEKLPLQESLASGLVATTFGLLAARAEGDEGLHRRLVRTVEVVDQFIAPFETMLPAHQRAQVRAFRTIALFARTFGGWRVVLDAEP
jgi:Linalool dehydratase/isomerase